MAKTNYERNKNSIMRYQQKMATLKLSIKPEEKERLRERAKAAGMSLTGYIRGILFGGSDGDRK